MQTFRYFEHALRTPLDASPLHTFMRYKYNDDNHNDDDKKITKKKLWRMYKMVSNVNLRRWL